ncbi:MAG: PAS domain S-box protein [Woeseia sp.]|nr:PAS domain S-box protein [Woeseia sp.]
MLKLKVREVRLTILVAIIFGMLAWVSIELTRLDGRIAAVWVANSFLLAFLFRCNRRAKIGPIMACYCANVIANLGVGDAPLTSIVLSAANTVEVLTILLLWRSWVGKRWKPRKMDHFLKMSAVFLPAAAISGAIATSFLVISANASFGELWFLWFSADALGLLILTPCLVMFVDGQRLRKFSRKNLKEVVHSGSIVAIATVAVFLLSDYPFLFLVCPAIIYAAFRGGTLATAVAIAIATLIASTATALNLGPITLVRGGVHDQIFALQVFLASNLFAGLPVAIKLEERMRIKRKLRESRDFNQAILDNIHEVIFRTDQEGRWTFLNPAWEKLTGFRIEESLGWPTTKLLHPDDLERDLPAYVKLANGEINATSFGQRFFDANGELTFIEVSVSRLTDDDGSFLGTAGYIRNVTDTRLVEQALRESHRQFQTLADLAPVGIFRTSPAGDCTYVNAAWQTITGLYFDEAQGEGWSQALHPDDSDRVFREWLHAVDNCCKLTTEFRWLRPQGDVRWVSMLSQPEHNEAGEMIGFVGVLIDITHHKKFEAALREAHERAEAAASAKSNFLANMSHEIRTPMNGVLGFAELLAQSELDDEQRRFTSMIRQSGEAMMTLLNDILDISKIEAGHMTLVERTVDLQKASSEAVAIMEPTAAQKGITLSLKWPSDLSTTHRIDPLRFRQILLNLVGNAIKFTDAGSVSVIASLEKENDRDNLVVAVKDTGIGIEEDRLEEIFNQFVQASEGTAQVYGGTGLGLAISSRLARLMNGSIRLSSTPGIGSEFKLVLPLKLAEFGDKQIEITSGETAGIRDVCRVLVAEDHEVNQQLMKAMADQAGFEVQIAQNGLDAVRAIEQSELEDAPFNFVLMDMQMPVMDGVAATREIRANGHDADSLPIIALTANAFADDAQRCIDAGMQAHIGKPVTLECLRQLCRKWSRKTNPDRTRQTALPDDLLELFKKQKCELLRLVEETMNERSCFVRSRQNLIERLHNIAGNAAYFGEEGLGRLARDLETLLETDIRNEEYKHYQKKAGDFLKAA